MKATAPDIRRRELAQIHVAKAQLGIDDETYRAMLFTIARVHSAADLDWRGRKLVLDHLKAKGFTIKSKRRAAPAAGKAALVAKIRAQLIALDNKPDAYADGIARQMFKVERFEWCSPEQLRKIVAALAYRSKKS